jgi:hypothetical protein
MVVYGTCSLIQMKTFDAQNGLFLPIRIHNADCKPVADVYVKNFHVKNCSQRGLGACHVFQ